jgi:hypothetical protein
VDAIHLSHMVDGVFSMLATISNAYINAPSWVQGINVDVAILTMYPNSGVSIGNRMGVLPVIAAPCTIPYGSTTSGYPADKTNGQMRTSGICPWWGSGCTGGGVISNQCDTAGGQSGSAYYTTSSQVFGVVSGGSNVEEYAFGFTQSWRDWVMTW